MENQPFVALVEALAAAGPAPAAPATGGAPAAAAIVEAAAGGGAAAAQQPRQPMRGTTVMSAFVLRHFCLLISTGVRTNKGFKEVHLN